MTKELPAVCHIAFLNVLVNSSSGYRVVVRWANLARKARRRVGI